MRRKSLWLSCVGVLHKSSSATGPTAEVTAATRRVFLKINMHCTVRGYVLHSECNWCMQSAAGAAAVSMQWWGKEGRSGFIGLCV
jgi:hypothetical protein